MFSFALVALWILILLPFSSASPLYYRSPLSASPEPTASFPGKTSVSSNPNQSTRTPEPSPVVDSTNTRLDWMREGNDAFRYQREEIMQQVENAPKVLFLGCSDSKLTPDILFQTEAGSTTSHYNLGNQFSGQDPNSASAIDYAIRELKVNHIVILGHYGCSSVENATQQLSKAKSSAIQKWLQPIADLYSRSKRFEIRRLRVLRKGSDVKSTTRATPSGLRALVEENVKTSVQNLQNEIISLLGETGYKEAELYGHGLVVDDETGQVKDLNVSFGPQGKPLVELPFDKGPKARMHIPFDGFQAKAKKMAALPVPTAGAQAAFSANESSS